MIKSQLKFLLKYFHLLDRYKIKSYSQSGEDLIIQYLLNLIKKYNPSYIDIGANHPFSLSNTAIFYEKGLNGINIEANPILIDLFKRARPRDKNLNIGIGVQSGKIPFYILDDNTLSTFSQSEAEAQEKNGFHISKIVDIEVKTLNETIDEFCNGIFPTLLTIDVEGLDVDIIKSTDFSKSKPLIICAETAMYSSSGRGKKLTDYINYIEGLGYYLYADTNINSVFIDQDVWNK